MLKRACLFLLTLSVTSALPAQDATITPNYKDADLTQIIEAVSQVTGKNFIIDPRLRGINVSMISKTPMTPAAFYEAFLSLLQVHGYVAVPAGNMIKILPDANARQFPGNDLPDKISSTSDELVTQVFSVANVNAGTLASILRPLLPPQGHMVAYTPTNTLIVSDRASSVNRIMRIIRRIDQAGDDELDIVQLQHASASEVVRVTNQLFPAAAAEGGTVAKLVSDDRTNSIIISGEKSQRLKLKTLVTFLDTPDENGGDTQVRYLRYADAEKISKILKDQATATVATVGGPPVGANTPASQLAKDVTILAEPDTNSLIITAPPKVMNSLLGVIDKLDIRRAQVLVEAIIVDVSLNKSAELGVNWAVFSNEEDARIPAAGFINPVGGVNLIDLARAVDDPSTVTNSGIVNGTTIGIGRLAAGGTNFAAMLRAIINDDNSNVVSFPQTVTMDNQEAEFKAAREVPFITGQFTNTGGGGNNGSVNPFQTINREEVGTILKITPQINAGDAVQLKIELESSDVLPTSAVQGAVDLTTSKRTISTNVIIEDGGIVVLGGLVSENFTRQESRVPFLGRIPLLGLAFKTRSGQNNRTNLMIFIRTKILRDGTQTAIETNAKYNYMREEQRKVGKLEILPILPGTKKPLLPELDEAQRKAAEKPPTPPPSEEDKKTPPGSAEQTTPPTPPTPPPPQ